MRRDPEGVETEHVRRIRSLHGARVLEIGVGDGRLTWRYGDLAKSIVAIDAGMGLLSAAAEGASQRANVSLLPVQAEAKHLPLAPESFEVALLAWSL